MHQEHIEQQNKSSRQAKTYGDDVVGVGVHVAASSGVAGLGVEPGSLALAAGTLLEGVDVLDRGSDGDSREGGDEEGKGEAGHFEEV